MLEHARSGAALVAAALLAAVSLVPAPAAADGVKIIVGGAHWPGPPPGWRRLHPQGHTRGIVTDPRTRVILVPRPYYYAPSYVAPPSPRWVPGYWSYQWVPQVSTSYDGWRLEPRDEKAFGPNAKYYKHDIAEAKKLLAAAGHANGMEMPSTFPRGTEYGVNFHKEVEVRQGFNTEAGFRFQNNPIDYQTEFIPKYRDSSGNFEGISYRLGPPAPSADPVGQMHYWYHSKAGVSFFGFDAGGKGDSSGDPQVDTALTKAQQEFDLEKRKALIVDIVRYLGGKMYSIQGMGGSNVFGLAWPAVQNVNVWRGGAANNARIQNTYWWLDDTKPPLKKA